MAKGNRDELSQEELEHLEAELLPKREALSVIGPLPATPRFGCGDGPAKDRGRRGTHLTRGRIDPSDPESLLTRTRR